MLRMMLGVLLVALSSAGGAQAPSFDVASVKPNKSGETRVRFALPPGRFTASNASLRDIIRSAYRISDFQLVNLPGWAAAERFDIEATTRPSQPSVKPMVLGPGGPPPELFVMLRALLAERFRLMAHTETREMPIYALVLARKDKALGAEMAPSTIDCAALAAEALANAGAPPKPPRPGQPPKCGMFAAPGRYEGWSATLTELAEMLTPAMGRTVTNQTGLAGGFDFKIAFTPPSGPQDPASTSIPPPLDSSGPSLTTALEEQLGLRLQSTRGPVEVLVIDSVSPPTPD